MWLPPSCVIPSLAALKAELKPEGGRTPAEVAELAEPCMLLSACTSAERMATANSAAAPEIHPKGPE